MKRNYKTNLEYGDGFISRRTRQCERISAENEEMNFAEVY